MSSHKGDRVTKIVNKGVISNQSSSSGNYFSCFRSSGAYFRGREGGGIRYDIAVFVCVCCTQRWW